MPYYKSVLFLEDGTIFYGNTLGAKGTFSGELCFNTGMTGYQEIFTDPSYLGQILVMANCHIGNYGISKDKLHPEQESDSIKISGMVCRNISLYNSRYIDNISILDYFIENNKIIIKDIDTRALVTYLRDKGSMNAVISSESQDTEYLKSKVDKNPKMEGLELVSKASTKKPYYFGNPDSKYRIALLDLGTKKSILKNLSSRDCYIKVFPFDTKFEEIDSWKPDGILLSNGPGDPRPLKGVIEEVKNIINIKIPLFGICLGHQVLCLCFGMNVEKMLNGHRGINHPVKNSFSNSCEITSQNHGFIVVKDSGKDYFGLDINYLNINDKTLAGIFSKEHNCFSVQFHPEANAGPRDSQHLFDKFLEIVNNNKNGKNI